MKKLFIFPIALSLLAIRCEAQTVGIGSASFTPQSTLDVKGNMTIGSTYGGTNAAPANGLIVQGNVGIGTTSPRANLEVNTNTATGGTRIIANNGSYGSLASPVYLRQDFVGYNFAVEGPRARIEVRDRRYDYNYSDMNFLVGNSSAVLTSAMFIDGNQGNVGIGTTNPTSILHTVASGAKTTSYTGSLLTNIATSSTALMVKAGLEVASTGTWNGTSASNIGLYVSSVTGGTNNYDAIFNGGGNVGIGTTSPRANLEVNTNTATGGTSIIANNGSYGSLASPVYLRQDFVGYNFAVEGPRARIEVRDRRYDYNYSDMNFLVGNSSAVLTSAMFIDGNHGNVGIGTTNPVQNLQLGNLSVSATATPQTVSLGGTYSNAAGSNPKVRVWTDGTGYIGFGASINQMDYITSNTAYDHVFYSSGTELMRIKGTGNVGIGCTDPKYTLHVIGDIASSATVRSTNAVVTGAITACSDVRYKTNIQPLTSSLNNILKLQGVSYNWKVKEFAAKNFSEKIQVGFIAQEMEKIYPQVVLTDVDGYKAIDYAKLTPVLVEVIKEQQKIIDAMKEEQKKSEIVNTDQQKTIESLQLTVLELKKAFEASVVTAKATK